MTNEPKESAIQERNQMTPKTKRRLKWTATEYEASGRYMVWSWSSGENWNASAMVHGEWRTILVEATKRQAIAACERHAREKGNS